MSAPGSNEHNDIRRMIDLVASVVPMLDTIRQSIEEGSGHIPGLNANWGAEVWNFLAAHPKP